jgi:hypothetical protein
MYANRTIFSPVSKPLRFNGKRKPARSDRFKSPEAREKGLLYPDTSAVCLGIMSAAISSLKIEQMLAEASALQSTVVRDRAGPMTSPHITALWSFHVLKVSQNKQNKSNRTELEPKMEISKHFGRSFPS